MAVRLCILFGMLAAACADPEYRYEFRNDLSYPVVVSGCGDCGDGRRVESNARVTLTWKPGARMTMSKTDGTRLGCGTASEHGGSTSDAMPVEASFYVGSYCE